MYEEGVRPHRGIGYAYHGCVVELDRGTRSVGMAGARRRRGKGAKNLESENKIQTKVGAHGERRPGGERKEPACSSIAVHLMPRRDLTSAAMAGGVCSDMLACGARSTDEPDIL